MIWRARASSSTLASNHAKRPEPLLPASAPWGGTQCRVCRESPLFQVRADILADAAADLDIEARVGGDLERLSRAKAVPSRCAVLLHAAGPGDNLHALGGLGPEMERARVDQAQGLAAAVRQQQRVA